MAELSKRGLAREIIEQVLAEVYAEVGEEDLAAEVVEKWRRRHRDGITTADIAKLAQSLSRRGFEWEVIRRHIENLTPVESSSDE